MTIGDLRKTIDELDDRLLSLLNERARAARQIGLLKQKQGLEILDPDREAVVLDRIAAHNMGPLNDHQVRAIFSLIVSSCRKIQE